MRAVTRWRAVLAIALIGAGSRSGGAQPSPNAKSADVASLRATIGLLGRESRGKLGVGVELLETRERVVVGAVRHPMQSVFKLPIAMAVLDRVDRGTLKLDESVDIPKSMYVTPGQHSPIRDKFPNGARLPLREILRLNTSESDGTACDVLLELLGGPAEATRYFRRIGVTEMIAATNELEIGRDRRAQYRSWATPAGALSLLRVVYERRALSDSSQALLMRFITETTTGLNRLRGELPAGTVVAHKTGSSGTVEGVAAATNDIGIITLPNGQHLAVAVFLTDSRVDLPARERIIARVARAAWETWVRPTTGTKD